MYKQFCGQSKGTDSSIQDLLISPLSKTISPTQTPKK